MADESTIQRVKELRVDALYGKKKHYNAADRKQIYHLRLGVPAVIINILLGSLLIGLLATALPEFVKWAGAALALIAALLTGLQTFFNFQKEADGHRRIGTRYLSVAKECNRLIAYHDDGVCSGEKLKEQFENLAGKYEHIILDAESLPTNSADYEKARQGFREEESYTDDELRYKGE